MKLTVAIPHHPARDEMLGPLLAKLGEPVEVVIDQHPSRRHPWMAMKEAWRIGTKLGGTHHLLVENDAIVCRDFLATVREVCEQWPGQITKFYTPNWASMEIPLVEQATRVGATYVRAYNWSTLTAVVMPTKDLAPFLHWGESRPTVYGYDADTRLRNWMQLRSGKKMGITVPSLVEHGGDRSLIPTRGSEGGHRSLNFIGTEMTAKGWRWEEPNA